MLTRYVIRSSMGVIRSSMGSKSFLCNLVAIKIDFALSLLPLPSAEIQFHPSYLLLLENGLFAEFIRWYLTGISSHLLVPSQLHIRHCSSFYICRVWTRDQPSLTNQVTRPYCLGLQRCPALQSVTVTGAGLWLMQTCLWHTMRHYRGNLWPIMST